MEKWLDHPLVFLFTMTLGVIGMTALLAWGFAAAGLSGPLGLVKGGATRG